MTTTMTHDELARALEALDDATAGSDADVVIKDRILRLAGADTNRRLQVLAIARERWTSWDRANRILACVASDKPVHQSFARALGEIEAMFGIVGNAPAGQTVEAVRAALATIATLTAERDALREQLLDVRDAISPESDSSEHSAGLARSTHIERDELAKERDRYQALYVEAEARVGELEAERDTKQWGLSVLESCRAQGRAEERADAIAMLRSACPGYCVEMLERGEHVAKGPREGGG